MNCFKCGSTLKLNTNSKTKIKPKRKEPDYNLIKNLLDKSIALAPSKNFQTWDNFRFHLEYNYLKAEQDAQFYIIKSGFYP